MIVLLKICFWLGTALIVYALVLYPLLIAVAARRWQRPLSLGDSVATGVSLVLSARNEQAHIARRLEELTGLLGILNRPGEVIVISDGSSDDTAAIAHAFSESHVRVIEWLDNRGKAAALNHGVSLARYEVVVCADARQRWSPDAIEQLLECLRDPAVGAVSGRLVLESAPGVLAGVGMYWQFEKWLRSQESLLHSQIGATGAISAFRRELFRPIPPGTILDDVYWPMQVVMQGRRVVYQPLATAYDQLPARSVDELRRKLRTLVGNFQLMSSCPELLNPWRNPVCWQFVSHKALRLVAPWAMLATFITSGMIASMFYQIAFLLQVVGLLMGVMSLILPLGNRHRMFSVAGSFLLLQFAAWLAFWYWVFGRSNAMWSPSSSQHAPVDL